MTLSSLKYDNEKIVEETRQGIFIYGGNVSRFHEWEFRTLLEISSCNKNDLPSKTSEIVKALRGEAATVAMDIGVEELLARLAAVIDGLDRIVDYWPNH